MMKWKTDLFNKNIPTFGEIVIKKSHAFKLHAHLKTSKKKGKNVKFWYMYDKNDANFVSEWYE